MRSKYLIVISLAFASLIACKPGYESEITSEEIQESINYLAGDELKGRFPGTVEDELLADYIVGEMDLPGLELASEGGKQQFGISRGFTVTAGNRIYIGDQKLTGDQYRVLGFSASDTVSGEFYVGSELPFSEYKDLDGKLLILPFPTDLPESEYDSYGILRSLCLDASDEGAAAVLFIYEGDLPAYDHPQRNPLNIPVIAVSTVVVENLITVESANIDDLFKTIKELITADSPEVTIYSEVTAKEILSYNTVTHLSGSNPDLSDQYVIIGAHHDHLGMGGRGTSSRRQDTIAIHSGADDNASGVVGVLEIAQNMIDRSPERSFVFTTFGGEELGLLGSKYYSKNPSVDLSSAQVMINLDMIGRLNEDRQLQIGGIGTSPVFREILDSLNTSYHFTMAYSEAGYGPSDHSSFYAKDVPVLFISTGAHTDYHTPADKAEKINYEGMVDVVRFVSDLAYELANLPEKIEFTMAGPKESSGSRGRMGMVTFGLMPDVMYDGNEGMPVSFVTAGKPAAIGGMKGGDIIKAVDGKSIGNVQDYMERLSELKEGQSVVVSVERKGEMLELLLKL